MFQENHRITVPQPPPTVNNIHKSIQHSEKDLKHLLNLTTIVPPAKITSPPSKKTLMFLPSTFSCFFIKNMLFIQKNKKA